MREINKTISNGMNSKNFNKGFSLVELIIYASLAVILMTVIIYATNAMFMSHRIIKATRNVENSGIAAMDRMVREIRAAQSIGAINSFGVSNGVLSLIVPTSGGGTKNVKFYLSSQKVVVDDDVVTAGQLTLSQVRATSLKFYSLSTTTSSAIKIELTLFGPTSTPSVSDSFYTTVVMRGSYQ